VDKIRRKALARLMAYCLGRRPDEFGLIPDSGGFVAFKQLERALAEEEGWGWLRESHIREIAHTAEGVKFEVIGETLRSGEPGALKDFFQTGAEPPPARLFHAARRKAYPVILERGLTAPPGGQLVLSTTPEMAMKVGRRRDHEPVLIGVLAGDAFKEGVSFTKAGELLYLSPEIAPHLLKGPPVERVPMPRKKEPKPEPKPEPPMPGTFIVRPEHLETAKAPGQRKRPLKGKEADPDWKRERRRSFRDKDRRE